MCKFSAAPQADSKKPAGPAALPLKLATTVVVWTSICALPLVLTSGNLYERVVPAEWYSLDATHGENGHKTIKPLGLALGILAVVVGQIFTVSYHYAMVNTWLGTKLSNAMRLEKVQLDKCSSSSKDVDYGAKKSAESGSFSTAPTVDDPDQPLKADYNYWCALRRHLSQPEGFALIGGYLIGTWMLGLMPQSYYRFEGGINFWHVLAQLLLQDALQYAMHIGEHFVSSWVYRKTHKPHHKHTNPIFYNAFDGSLGDTTLMIIIPFACVARIVPANVWSYMMFGTLYANWLVLIHCEFGHAWDGLFAKIGFGTAADHHVHHKLFRYNYGHLFMYWDNICGTRRT